MSKVGGCYTTDEDKKISRPTGLIRGIHIEYDNLKKSLKGVPNEWIQQKLVPTSLIQPSGITDYHYNSSTPKGVNSSLRSQSTAHISTTNKIDTAAFHTGLPATIKIDSKKSFTLINKSTGNLTADLNNKESIESNNNIENLKISKRNEFINTPINTNSNENDEITKSALIPTYENIEYTTAKPLFAAIKNTKNSYNFSAYEEKPPVIPLTLRPTKPNRRQMRVIKEFENIIKISKPVNFVQNTHVVCDPNSVVGLSGLPEEWVQKLKSAGFTSKDIITKEGISAMDDIINNFNATPNSDAHAICIHNKSEEKNLTGNSDNNKTTLIGSPSITFDLKENTIEKKQINEDYYKKIDQISVFSQSPILVPKEKKLLDGTIEIKYPVFQLPTEEQLHNSFNSINEIYEVHSNPKVFYTNIAIIGRGSSGTVYRATEKATGKVVAIKVIAADELGQRRMKKNRNTNGNDENSFDIENVYDTENDLSSSETNKKESSSMLSAQQLTNEMCMMYLTKHKNSVELYKVYERPLDGNRTDLWLVMEYLKGGSLTSVLNTHGSIRNETIIAWILKDVLQVIAYMHTRHRLHRDIKSDQCLIDITTGHVKLADFGFTVQLTEETSVRNSVVGSVYWMAPELVRGFNYTTAVDIWSIGILALELAQGLPPYMELPPLRAAFLIVTQPPAKLSHPQKWSVEFNHFLARCMQKDPMCRATAEELLNHPFLNRNLSEQVGKDLLDLLECNQKYNK